MLRKLIRKLLPPQNEKITSAAKSPPFQFHYPENSQQVKLSSSIQKPDLLIGAISGYNYSQIRYWVNSLNQTGFTGGKVVIAYDASYDTVDKLIRNGFQVVTFSENSSERRFFYPLNGFRHKDTSIDRFYQIWRFLELYSDNYRYVISMDVKDIIFQSNPSIWLENNLGDMKINVGSECIPESWNLGVTLESYGPIVHQKIEKITTMNAGTIAGKAKYMQDLILNVFLCAQHNSVPYTDQAALNILLTLEPYKSITRFNRFEDDWACQSGVKKLPKYKSFLESNPESSPPKLDGDWVVTPSGSRYCIVHQYDRIPRWRDVLQQKYEN